MTGFPYRKRNIKVPYSKLNQDIEGNQQEIEQPSIFSFIIERLLNLSAFNHKSVYLSFALIDDLFMHEILFENSTSPNDLFSFTHTNLQEKNKNNSQQMLPIISRKIGIIKKVILDNGLTATLIQSWEEASSMLVKCREHLDKIEIRNKKNVVFSDTIYKNNVFKFGKVRRSLLILITLIDHKELMTLNSSINSLNLAKSRKIKHFSQFSLIDLFLDKKIPSSLKIRKISHLIEFFSQVLLSKLTEMKNVEVFSIFHQLECNKEIFKFQRCIGNYCGEIPEVPPKLKKTKIKKVSPKRQEKGSSKNSPHHYIGANKSLLFHSLSSEKGQINPEILRYFNSSFFSVNTNTLKPTFSDKRFTNDTNSNSFAQIYKSGNYNNYAPDLKLRKIPEYLEVSSKFSNYELEDSKNINGSPKDFTTRYENWYISRYNNKKSPKNFFSSQNRGNETSPQDTFHQMHRISIPHTLNFQPIELAYKQKK